jgi:hypothetical protein
LNNSTKNSSKKTKKNSFYKINLVLIKSTKWLSKQMRRKKALSHPVFMLFWVMWKSRITWWWCRGWGVVVLLYTQNSVFMGWWIRMGMELVSWKSNFRYRSLLQRFSARWLTKTKYRNSIQVSKQKVHLFWPSLARIKTNLIF